MARVLLLGAGNRRIRHLHPDGGSETFDGDELVTLDVDVACGPAVIWDLERPDPLPFPDDRFDEIHAYEVLEHLGGQGDYQKFFSQFADYWRVLKPDGVLCASTPLWSGVWAWGDPGHRRVINFGTLAFLSQAQYQQQVGKTAMSDYRSIYKADFDLEFTEQDKETFLFVIKCIKPSRWRPR